VAKQHAHFNHSGRLPSAILRLALAAAIVEHLRSTATWVQPGLHRRLPAARGQPPGSSQRQQRQQNCVLRRAVVEEVLFDDDDDILPAAGGFSSEDDLLMQSMERFEQDKRCKAQVRSMREATVEDLEVVEHVLLRRLRHDVGSHDGVYVDLTFGRGGHSRAILQRLSPKGQLHAFDIDLTAVAVARDLERKDSRFHMFHQSFAQVGKALDGVEVHGVVLDLGSWDPQVHNVNRGRYIAANVPLDSHLNQQQNVSATKWLTRISAEELAWVIHEYSDLNEPLLAERIALAVLERQKCLGPYTYARELSRVVKAVGGPMESRDLAKETIEAIRIFLNSEIEHMYLALAGAFKLLATGGRCAVITSNQMQHRTVLRFLREREEPPLELHAVSTWPTTRLCEVYPLVSSDLDYAVARFAVGGRLKASERIVNRSRSSLISMVKLPRRVSHCVDASPRELVERFVHPQHLPFLGGLSLKARHK